MAFNIEGVIANLSWPATNLILSAFSLVGVIANLNWPIGFPTHSALRVQRRERRSQLAIRLSNSSGLRAFGRERRSPTACRNFSDGVNIHSSSALKICTPNQDAVHSGLSRSLDVWRRIRRTNGCTSDRGSALLKWLIARAIEVNRTVRRLQTPTPDIEAR